MAMTTLIQSTSNVGNANTVTPLYVVRKVSQNGTVASSAVVIPSSITTLGLDATNNSASLTYDPISLLQSFSPTFSVSGLTQAQHQQLALALGLSASATSTDLTNAINALLTPANPADALVNVLVGGATTETTNSIIPSFLNTNGEIAGVPATTASQVSDTVFATLLDLGTTTAISNTNNTTANNAPSITASSSAVSTNQTAGTAPAATNLINPASNNTQGVAANTPAASTSPVQGNLPTTSSNIATAEYLATAVTTNTANTTVNNAQVITENPSSTSANQSAGAAPAATEAATILTNPVPNNTQGVVASAPAVNTNPVQGNLPTTSSNIATEEYLATAALNVPTPATAVINATTTPVTLPTGNTTQAPFVANIATAETAVTPAPTAITTTTTAATTATATTTTPVITTAATATISTPIVTTEATALPVTNAVIANATANLLAENTILSVGNLPATGVTEGQITPAIAQTVTPTVTPTSTTVTTAATVATTTTGAVANILPPTTATPAATAPTVNATPITFDNAESVLQALLADAASHALITANQAAATYAIPGTVYQLGSGVDHTRQADLKGNLPNIRYTFNPVARVAAVRGTLKRQT
jgi:hypothetical protein